MLTKILWHPTSHSSTLAQAGPGQPTSGQDRGSFVAQQPGQGHPGHNVPIFLGRREDRSQLQRAPISLALEDFSVSPERNWIGWLSSLTPAPALAVSGGHWLVFQGSHGAEGKVEGLRGGRLGLKLEKPALGGRVGVERKTETVRPSGRSSDVFGWRTRLGLGSLPVCGVHEAVCVFFPPLSQGSPSLTGQ
jgi:hypothetical protein